MRNHKSNSRNHINCNQAKQEMIILWKEEFSIKMAIFFHQITPAMNVSCATRSIARVSWAQDWQHRSADCFPVSMKITAGNAKVLFYGVKYNGYDYNIASIFGQEYYGRNGCFTDYDALRRAMEPIRVMATPFPAYPLTTVRIPYKMGCGLGGGDWSIVSRIIQEELVDKGIPVEIWRL